MRVQGLFFLLMLIVGVPVIHAQVDPDLAEDCGNITPRGGGRSDTKAIRNCLCTQRKAILSEGQFFLGAPVLFPRRVANPDPANCKFGDVTGTMLVGKGEGTVLNLKASCSAPWPASGSPLTFEPVIDVFVAQGAIIKDLAINLANMRQDCNPSIKGGFAVRLNRSPDSTVSGLRIFGSTSTSGGANAGGINVIKSEGTAITGNTITDLGYARDQGTTSNGTAGIRLDNSGCTTRCSRIEGNTIARVSFAIEVSNQVAEGDSSGAQVINNDITGASQVTACGPVGCSQGRAIKVQAFGSAAVRNLVVELNKARNFGGFREGGTLLRLSGSGLDLIGVQNSRFTGNIIDAFGDPASGLGGINSAAEFGLQLRPFPGGVTEGNTFSRNFFRSGHPGPPCPSSCTTRKCKDGCVDVNFNGVPDQNGLSRASQGDNNFRNYRQ